MEAHDVTVYRSNDGATYDVSEVLGSGGTNYAGERRNAAAFAEMSLPLGEKLDLRLGGRGDEADDVGGMTSWRLGANLRPSDIVTLRGSWSAGERAPSMVYLHSSEFQDHPYIECDPGTGSPPRSCPEINPRQVTRVTKGNTELDPSKNERVAVGAEVRKWPFFANVEWYRLSRSGLPGQNSADWAMQNLRECMHPARLTRCIERTRRRNHHSQRVRKRRRRRGLGHQLPDRRRLQNGVGGGRTACVLAAREQRRTANRG